MWRLFRSTESMTPYLELSMKRYLLLLPFIFLTGCSTKYVEVVKVEYEYVTYDIPKSLTSRCIPPRPISPVEYNTLDEAGKREYLANYTITLLGEVKKCDNKLQSVDRLIKEQNKTIEEYNAGKNNEERKKSSRATR